MHQDVMHYHNQAYAIQQQPQQLYRVNVQVITTFRRNSRSSHLFINISSPNPPWNVVLAAEHEKGCKLYVSNKGATIITVQVF